MTIFLVKIYGKSWAILEVNSPWIRIILRAEKALRVTSTFFVLGANPTNGVALTRAKKFSIA